MFEVVRWPTMISWHGSPWWNRCPTNGSHLGSATSSKWKAHTVDGSLKSGDHQLRLVVYPHYLQGFIHPRWLFGISSINSIKIRRIPLDFINHHLTSLSLSLAPSISISCKALLPEFKHKVWPKLNTEPASFQCYPFNLHFMCRKNVVGWKSSTNRLVNSSFRSQRRRFWSGHSWLVNLGIGWNLLSADQNFGMPFWFCTSLDAFSFEETIHSIMQPKESNVDPNPWFQQFFSLRFQFWFFIVMRL